MNLTNIGDLKESGFFIFKIASVVLLILYFIYAFVIVKQVILMTQTIDVAFKKPIKFIAYIHLFYASALLIYAIIM